MPFTVKLPPGELEVVLGALELVGRDRAGLLDDLLAGLVEGDAADGERPAAVGVHPERDEAVSPWITSTSSKPTPSWSATICAKVVTWPWPCGEIPITTRTVPAA